MRSSGAFVLAIVTGVLLMPSPAPAAWCADYSLGTTNCGFPSFQACRAAVSGVGGMSLKLPKALNLAGVRDRAGRQGEV